MPDDTGQTSTTTLAVKLKYQHLFTPHEFWEALDRKIGKNSIYELLRANKIRHIRVGRKLLIPRSEIEAFLERELV